MHSSTVVINIEALYERIRNESITKEEIEQEYWKVKKSFHELQSLLELAKEIKPQDEAILQLYRQLVEHNMSDLVDRLTGYGYLLVNTDKIISNDNRRIEFKKRFRENHGFRLLELTRLAKRDEVQYLLLRIFFSFQVEFPKILLEPFKPIYSNEMFKVLIFSFLSGVLGNEKENL